MTRPVTTEPPIPAGQTTDPHTRPGSHLRNAGTTDAIFQGLHPYTVGQAGVAEYYAAQPTGMTAVYTLRETRALSDGLVLGYLTVDFGFSDRATLTVYLSVIIRQGADGWRIVHYQVSRLD